MSGIILAGFIAKSNQKFSWLIFGLIALTTILLQILSNYANDYGDSENGADSAARIGPERGVQSGAISKSEMFKAIIVFGTLSFISGVLLLFAAFESLSNLYFQIFLGIGLLSILAAYFYTAGKKPYGYAGLGDLSVFLFFGIVGVFGSVFLFTKTIDLETLLPAIACGGLATGVLNINNIRDINSDKTAGKITIPVRLGKPKAIIYHLLILILAFVSMTIFILNSENHSYYFLLGLPLLILNAYKVATIDNPDPYLKQLALSSLAFSILSGLSI